MEDDDDRHVEDVHEEGTGDAGAPQAFGRGDDVQSRRRPPVMIEPRTIASPNRPSTMIAK